MSGKEMEARAIPFRGIVNGRDLGGIVTAEGKTIRKGLLLRTGDLSKATEEDRALLAEEYRLAVVIDLRTRSEREQRGDRLPAGVEYIARPVFNEAAAGITREDGTPTPFELPEMGRLYRTMIREPACREALRAVLKTIFTHDYDQGAVLWHCTGGKDRSGIVASLVLAALGADRETILSDYAINPDEFIAQSGEIYRQALRSGRKEEEAAAASDVFLALPRYLESAFAAIDEEYSSTEAYLTEGLKIPAETIAEFRRKVLL